MTMIKLTFVAAAATIRAKTELFPARAGQHMKIWRGIGAMAALVGCAMMVSGCISVNTPDKPIVIELNINIKQEVIYRLSADAGKTIDNNKDIF